MVLNPSYLHTSLEMLIELRAERTEEKFCGVYVAA
jgi:hypothetical protein